ncbi:hypothetical protein H6P81_018913 [Aristolochia fimbriata]|uniref:BLOC-1-related complex subunit 5 n=1 Tax=Aristolochia fimbriata TaxID=158543 RepID=A0AAV7E2L6_ARIFI|nr:hypothetical protein H6P81_018913 [Aristolochia fimbriata]
MGSSESTLSSYRQPVDEITTVSQKSDSVDPILERLKSLKITSPILKTPLPDDSSLTDILVRKPSTTSVPGNLNPNILLELFSLYRDWQEERAMTISKKQEEIENKIEVTDALAVKLLQRFNYSGSAMRTTAHHLSAVEPLQLEVGKLKGRLTEVISNCDALCKRISTDGPEALRSSIKPFSLNDVKLPEHSSSHNDKIIPSAAQMILLSPPQEKVQVLAKCTTGSSHQILR